MLENPFSPRLLKKVQTTHPTDGYPAARDAPGTHRTGVAHRRWVGGVLSPYVAAPRERAGYQSGGWVRPVGLFQQPVSLNPKFSAAEDTQRQYLGPRTPREVGRLRETE
jgi:hypothetical protein